MTSFFEKTIRHLVPRWRTTSAAVSLGEVTPLKPTATSGEVYFNTIEQAREQWRRSKDLFSATEFVSDALLQSDNSPDAITAAEFVVHSTSSRFAKAIANAVLQRPAELRETELPDQTQRAAIRRLRRRLGTDPRNALAWTDMALAYTSLGQVGPAEEALRRAAILARDSRLVLRSAARFWVHRRKPERALYLLRRAPGLLRDPWLLAAEVAISFLAQAPLVSLKVAQRLIDSGDFPEHSVSELAGALGTVTMFDSNLKFSRRLFRKSLVAPTDNSVAQAAWASFEIGSDMGVSDHLDLSRSFEARARTYAHLGSWIEAVKESTSWLADQPFSASAATFASYTAAVGLDDYRHGEELARAGLAANPGNPMLLNNLAFCLANQSRSAEAERVLARMTRDDIDNDGVFLATTGLIAFRKQAFEAGRDWYRRAIEFFEQKGLPKSRALAAIYLAREELRVRSSLAESAIAQARRLAEGRSEPEVIGHLANFNR